MGVPKIWVTVVGVLALALLGSPGAQAETAARKDRAGDAPAGIDVTRARYSYGHGRVAVFARVPDLGRVGDAQLSVTRLEIFEAGYVVRVVRRAGEPPRVGLFYFDHFKLHRRRCDHVSGSWGAGSISLSAPTACLKGHATPKVFVQFGLQRGRSLDLAPAVKRLARD